jgi:hypothetical protein
MGDSDLSAGDRRARPSLAALIGAGDADVIAGFREAHTEKIRRYCAEVCSQERVDEAVAAAFVDFLARLRVAEDPEQGLDELLLQATRSAAAPRFEVSGPPSSLDVAGFGLRRDCEAMPELLAAIANGELRRDDAARQHIESCETCAASAERIQQAERAFLQAPAVPS